MNKEHGKKRESKIPRWLDWRGLVVFVGVVTTILLLTSSTFAVAKNRIRSPRFLNRWRQFLPARFFYKDKRIEFYRRFESLLARRKLQRSNTQTQLEFVMALASTTSFASQVEAKQAAQRIVDAFYRIRFGQQDLDETRLAEVERDLQTIEKSLVSAERAALRKS